MSTVAAFVPWLSRQGAMRGGLLLGLPVLLVLGSAALLARSADAQKTSLRDLRVHEQRLQQQASRLRAAGATERLAALGESRDALRVRLLETLVDIRESPAIGELIYRIDEHAMRVAVSDVGDGFAATLRLNVSGRVADGGVLIELLGQLVTSTRPWPVEVRGCQVQRQADSTSTTLSPVTTGQNERLAVECAIDVLHWADLQVPHGL